MSEDEVIDIAEKIANFGWSDYDDFVKNKKAIQGLLDLHQKEIEEYNLLLKRFRHLIKSKIISSYDETKKGKYFKDISKFDTDYISKDKIREFKNKFIKDSKNEKVFMTQSSQINASLIQFCNELLEERN